MESLEVSDSQAAAVAKAPRVTLDDIKSSIKVAYYTTAAAAIDEVKDKDIDKAMSLLTVCFVVTQNNFIVIGKSAPAAPENFNAELGKKFAYEDCIRQLWPLMGYALRDRLHNSLKGN